MFGAESFGGQPGIRPLVHHLVAVKANGEGFDFLVRAVDGKIQNGGGIHAATGEDAHRHIGDHVVAHRRGEQSVKFLHRLIEGHLPALPGEAQIPVGLLCHLARFNREMMSGRQLVDVFEQGFGSGQVMEREKFPNGRQIDFTRHLRVGNDGLQFGGKVKCRFRLTKIERFDAHAVACHEQPPLSCVPDGKGKHPAQFPHAVRPEFLIGMDDDFCVRLRPEDMAFGQESFAQFLKVVNLPVENNPDGFVFIRHRLRAGVEVNNGQPEMTQAGVGVQMNSFTVRAAVAHGIEHGLD